MEPNKLMFAWSNYINKTATILSQNVEAMPESSKEAKHVKELMRQSCEQFIKQLKFRANYDIAQEHTDE